MISHALSCKNLRARIARHNALVEDTFQWLSRRKVHVRKEVTGVVPGTAHRVDLVVRADGVVHWCDAVVTDPGNPSVVLGAAGKQGFAVDKAEQYKISKWKKLAPVGVQVVPLAMESTGLIGPEMSKFLERMVKKSRGSKGPRLGSLLMQLSVTCVRYGGEMVREACRF